MRRATMMPTSCSKRGEGSLAALAVVVLAGCVGAEANGFVGWRTDPLTQAALDTEDPAVVAIMFGDHAACTGVLVARNVVLTAAHCLVTQTPRPRVVFGTDATVPEAVVDVSGMFVHAEFSLFSRAHDIAALRLDQEAPAGAVPVGLPFPSLINGAQGTSVRLVGFGHDVDTAEASAPHVKRQGTATIGTVGPDTIVLAPAPAQACVGDSGGPVLIQAEDAEVLAGLVLGGVTSCTDTATALRVDAYADSFIQPIVAGFVPPFHPQGSTDAGGCEIAPTDRHPPPPLVLGLLLAILLARRRRRRISG